MRQGTRRGDLEASLLARRLAAWSIGLLGIGAALGALILASLWWGDRREIFSAAPLLPPRKLEYAAVELLFSLLCMAAYLALGNRAIECGGWRRVVHHLLAFAAATNLIYHFPPLFLALRRLGDADAAMVQAQFRSLIFAPPIASMWLHHTLAGFAGAGVWTMFVSRSTRRSGEAGQPARTTGVSWGARIALVATLFQIPVGLWVLAALPEQDALLGGDAITTGLLAAGIAVALALMHHLAAASLGQVEHSAPQRCLALLLAVMLLMNAANYRARQSQPPTSPRHVPHHSN
jgi:hypothetical protein